MSHALPAEVAEALADAGCLGFGEPVAISAETGEGMGELYQALRPPLDAITETRRKAVAAIQEVSELWGGRAWVCWGGWKGGRVLSGCLVVRPSMVSPRYTSRGLEKPHWGSSVMVVDAPHIACFLRLGCHPFAWQASVAA